MLRAARAAFQHCCSATSRVSIHTFSSPWVLAPPSALILSPSRCPLIRVGVGGALFPAFESPDILASVIEADTFEKCVCSFQRSMVQFPSLSKFSGTLLFSSIIITAFSVVWVLFHLKHELLLSPVLKKSSLNYPTFSSRLVSWLLV